MTFHFSHFSTAQSLIQQYDASLPLSHYLKQYFAQHKKHGSKDRKQIAHICYCYYRTGHALQHLSMEKRIAAAVDICENGEKKELLDISLLFPFADELSDGIDAIQFSRAHLTQPDLFIRIRPGKEAAVLNTLLENNIAFEKEENCLRLSNTTPINRLLQIDTDVVIQDLSSQAIAKMLKIVADKLPQTVWDCCAASGGKSLLVHDTFPKASITISDIRPSIIHNLRSRFERAGITKYQWFVADLTEKVQTGNFSLVICDAPCSGSGTWSRTPEQLYFFDENKIAAFSQMQKNIVLNVISHIAEGGYFLYITCSVFKRENEDVVQYILEKTSLQPVEQQLLKGYDKKADTMFAALFQQKQ